MTDAATYARGAELGFQGADFYLVGRGGRLGAAPASVAPAALVFFAPEVVEPAWARAGAVMPHAQAAREWAASLHAHARQHDTGQVDWTALATMLGRVVAFAPV